MDKKNLKKYKLTVSEFNYAFFERKVIEEKVELDEVKINRERCLRLIKSMEVLNILKKYR